MIRCIDNVIVKGDPWNTDYYEELGFKNLKMTRVVLVKIKQVKGLEGNNSSGMPLYQNSNQNLKPGYWSLPWTSVLQ